MLLAKEKQKMIAYERKLENDRINAARFVTDIVLYKIIYILKDFLAD